MAHETIAIGRWTLDAQAIPVVDGASAAVVRERVREEAARVGLPEVAAASLVNVASELAHNQIAHAGGGVVLVREARGPVTGLEVVAADGGPGILDVARALEGRPSGRRSLGVGLAAALELADEVDFDVRLGEGTCVWARKFAHHDVRRRRVGVYGRAFPGEPTSGDDTAFARDEHGLLVGVVDGLGHGVLAREAAERAAAVLQSEAARGPEEVLRWCDKALDRTRGAVMAAARVEEPDGQVVVSSVGNIGVHVVEPGRSRRFAGSSFVLGAPGGARRVMTERSTLDRHAVLVLFSDGVSSRAELDRDVSLLHEHPVVIAQRIVERHARDNDDATVLVVA